ncbi:MAG: efflux RND transporter periplasmic adaptor subunit, partial [Desulfobulbia bacterium]
MKKTIFKIGMALLVLLTVQCSTPEAEKEEVLRPINFIKLGNDSGAETRAFNGTATAGNQIELSFRESGIIQKTNVSTGQRVKKGDLIATLDNIEANLNFQRSIKEVISAESAMNTSKAEFDRVKLLYEKGSTPLRDYQTARNNYQNTL